MRALALVLAFGGCAGCKQGVVAEAPRERVVTIIATAELRGTPEPCGCQSDPLGDIARVAGLVRGGALLVDAGGLRYSAEPIQEAERPQAEMKAELLEQAWRDLGAVVALGDEDLREGAARLAATKRVVANASGAPWIEPRALRDAGGVKVGVFGLVDPAKTFPGLTVSDPVAAARREVDTLRSDGAQVIVALMHLGRAEARRVARAVPGLHVVVAGDEVGDGGVDDEGAAILVAPATEGQKVARVELHIVDGKVATTLVDRPEKRGEKRARVEKKLAAATEELARLVADPAADQDFVRTKREQVARLAAERDGLRGPPPQPTGSHATATLVPIRRKLPRDEKMAAAMRALDARAGEANRAAGEKVPVPQPPAGEPRYVGMSACEDGCHDEAVEQWQKTVHARAWKTLADANKQWSFDCIKCHVTGYGQAGGSAMGHVKDLEAVQCEVCHGPGSLHAEKPKQFHLRHPTESDCKGCHTKEHSDTFAFAPYLRDVLGAGHGEKRRATLGDGPTGHELRGAAEKRASE
jgi:hypothetical protein